MIIHHNHTRITAVPMELLGEVSHAGSHTTHPQGNLPE